MSLKRVWKQDIVGAFPFLSPRASSSVLISCSQNMLPLCLSSVLIYMHSTFFTVPRPCQNSNSSNNNNTTGSCEVSRVFCVLCLSMELWALCVIPSTSLWAVVPLHKQGSESAARLMARTGHSQPVAQATVCEAGLWPLAAVAGVHAAWPGRCPRNPRALLCSGNGSSLSKGWGAFGLGGSMHSSLWLLSHKKDKAAYLTRECNQVCERKSSSPCLLARGAAHPLPVGQFCLAWVVWPVCEGSC